VEYTDGFILFLFLTVFTVATIIQCFMFSVFFSRANLAAACAAIFYFIGYLPYALVLQWEEFMRNWQKSLAVSCLSFDYNYSYNIDLYSMALEYTVQGLLTVLHTVKHKKQNSKNSTTVTIKQ